MISDRKAEKGCILIGLEEVVHEVCIEQSLNNSSDEGGPDYQVPSENPILGYFYQWKM